MSKKLVMLVIVMMLLAGPVGKTPPPKRPPHRPWPGQVVCFKAPCPGFPDRLHISGR